MIETIEAKQLLTSVKSGGYSWFGMDYNMNLYRGCCHGCIYCDSRSSCYQVKDFDQVRVKGETDLMLRQALKGKKKKGVIGIGAMSDTYNPFEKEQKVTRKALEVIAEYGFGVGIDTKSALVTRDIDLLSEITRHHSAIVKVTITAADDKLSRKIEPHVNPSSERFKALTALSDAGIYAGVLLTPVLPWITDNRENLLEIVQRAKACGAKFVYCSYGVTLRDNQREYFYDRLNELFPGVRKNYLESFGNSYGCQSPQEGELKFEVRQACEALGLHYRMKDIIAGYKKADEYDQLSLF